jgi:hypothetical protein
MSAVRTSGTPCLAALALLLVPAVTCAQALPAHLPRYQVGIDLDVTGHKARVRMEATWINPHPDPTQQVVFNAHSRYVVPSDQIGFTAKMLEILRMTPSEAMGVKEPSLQIHRISLKPPGNQPEQELPINYEGDTKTSLVVPLPFAVRQGEAVTVVLDMTMDLPQKQGRWGQWEGVTVLSNWLPVFAFYGNEVPKPKVAVAGNKGPRVVRAAAGDKTPGADAPHSPGPACWQPTPFIAWHQPFFNEAGIYTVRVCLPAGQRVGTSGTIKAVTPLPNGRKQVDIEAIGVREYTLVCSARFSLFEGVAKAGPGGAPVRVHVLAFPEHEFFAKHFVRIAIEALEKYNQWLGPYPWADFTITESFFGWNGNECSTLVMIDERVFGMPHVGIGYVEYLISHETCHQWWYNLIGTNGYCETWMDEANASYFSHRLLNQKLGRENTMMTYPAALRWLPNIRREDYRSSGMYSTFAKGESTPVVQEMTGFGHLANLFNLCYDKGGRIVGMIEARLGKEEIFLDFMRVVVKKYQYRILRVEDFRRELELYTGYSWKEFFDDWLYGTGISDWSVEKVTLTRPPKCASDPCCPCPLKRRWLMARAARPDDEVPPGCVRATVWLHQKAQIDEPTVLGFSLPNCEGYAVRIPIYPRAPEPYTLEEPPATVTPLGSGEKGGSRVKVEIVLPAEPTQIAVDPDQVLVDAEPDNNYWHTPIRWRVTPLYTFLEETDLTAAYDRWNLIFGPWLFSAPYQDAWFTRSTMAGLRAGAYRTQQFNGGAYIGFRTDYRDVVAGVDGIWDHFPDCHWQSGFIAERRIAEFNEGDSNAVRAAVWTRYIFTYGSSLYLPPIHFLEGFAHYSDNFLPFPTQKSPGGVRFDQTTTAGLHYRINYLTPYWDPEGGFQFDAWYEGGLAQLPATVGVQQMAAQFSMIKSPPDLSHYVEDWTWLRRGLSWLSDTRVAVRAYGATAAPSRGEFFTMGSDVLFRGFDMAQRQGSTVWVGSVEWRVPVAQRLHVDMVDHVIGVRNVYLAGFYDVGDAYVRGHQVAPVAHGLGGGLRLDVAWFSFVERTTLRLDVAKSINTNTGVQVWLGINQPF